MTDEAQSPEETYAPPASTRWSEDVVESDEGLAPPFVPGRPAESAPAGSVQGAAPAQPPVEERPVEEPAAEQAAPTEAEPFASQGLDEAQAATPASTEPEEVDDFPFEQFDIEGEAEPEPGPEDFTGWTPADLAIEEPFEAESDEELVAESDAEPVAEERPGLEEAATEEVAALLERIAGLLREEGIEAVRAEMESSDRLTALIAGLVAGYVSGRQ